MRLLSCGLGLAVAVAAQVVTSARPGSGTQAAGSPGAGDRELLAGIVVDASQRPVAGAAVSFHFSATFGVPWLRSAADAVEVRHGTTGVDGRFAFEAPAGTAGTVLAEKGASSALAMCRVAGEPVRLELSRTKVRSLVLWGEVPAQGLWLAFEGATPLAARPVAIARPATGGSSRANLGATVTLPALPGLGGVLQLPEGYLHQSAATPWLGASGASRDRVRLGVTPVLPLARRWARTGEAPCIRLGEGPGIWGHGHVAWVGQCADGRPFVALGDREHLAGEGMARRIACAGASEVVVAANVLVAAGEDVVFTVAERLAVAGGTCELPAWLSPGLPQLVLARDKEGWRVCSGGPREQGPAYLRGSVRNRDRSPSAGATVRVLPLGCRPKEPWQSFAGLEATARAHGAFTLPVRLAAGDHEWIAMATDGRVATGTLSLVAGDNNLRIELPDGGNLSGVVIDGDGEPVAGLLVELRAGRDERPLSFGWPEHRTFTGSSGEFEFGGLDPDTTFELVCGSAAWGDLVVDNVRAGTTLSLQLRPPASPR